MTILVILVAAGAVYNSLVGALGMLAVASTSPDTAEAIGDQQAQDVYPFISAPATLVLGLLAFWLARITMTGSAAAYRLILVLASMNIVLGIMTVPQGWGIIALNALCLVLVNLRSTRDFLSGRRERSVER